MVSRILNAFIKQLAPIEDETIILDLNQILLIATYEHDARHGYPVEEFYALGPAAYDAEFLNFMRQLIGRLNFWITTLEYIPSKPNETNMKTLNWFKLDGERHFF